MEFGRTRANARYLVSGGSRDGRVPEWESMRRLLLDGGVADEHIIVEAHGTDTLSQIRLCASILRSPGASGSVWIATSRYHQARCWLLFRLFGIGAGIVPSLRDRPTLSRRSLVWFWVREFVALPYDTLVALLRYRLKI